MPTESVRAERDGTGRPEAVVMGGGIRNILILQIGLVVAAGAGGLALYGPDAAKAVLYGGALGIANSVLLARRVQRAGEAALGSPAGGMAALYIGAVQRFVLVLGGFALGMGVLGLAPLSQIIGFAVTQLGYVLPTRR